MTVRHEGVAPEVGRSSWDDEPDDPPAPTGRRAATERPGSADRRAAGRPAAPGRTGFRVRRFRAVALVVGALVLGGFLRGTFLETARAADGAMAPSVQPGDVLAVRKWGVGLSDLSRGDVVIVRIPPSWSAQARTAPPAARMVGAALGVRTEMQAPFRLVGLPGDHVQGDAEGAVRINGVQVDERRYVSRSSVDPLQPFDVVVPAGRLWLMSDDRTAGSDSQAHLDRQWSGTLPAEDVAGVVLAVVWPLQDLRSVAARGFQ